MRPLPATVKTDLVAKWRQKPARRQLRDGGQWAGGKWKRKEENACLDGCYGDCVSWREFSKAVGETGAHAGLRGNSPGRGQQ